MKTTIEMLNEIQEKFPFLELAEEYKGANEKILIRCKNCGYEWKAIPYAVKMSKHGCPKCGVAKANFEKSKIRFIEKLDTSKYEFVDFISPSEVIVKCKTCGNIRHTTPSNIYRYGCKNCSSKASGLKRRKTTEQFIEDARKIHGDRYDYSKVEYTTDRDPVIIICPIHGEFAQTPIKHLSGHGCRKCAGREWTVLDFITEAKKVHGDKYDYSKVEFEKGHKNSKKLTIICPKHGEFQQEAWSHLGLKCGCPKCNQSKGEKLVSDILKSLNIKYDSQYRIKNPYDSHNFVLDFYIEIYDNKYVIEYNGKQHYIPIDIFGGQEAFDILTKRDSDLRKYCNDNNLNLLEIKYDKSEEEVKNLILKFLPSVDEKSNGLLQSNIGESCDVNTEITEEIKKSSAS